MGDADVAEVEQAPVKLTLKQRLKAHFADYGRIAIYTYLSISVLTIAGFSIAIGAGVAPSSATGVFGVIGAGWVAAKATMPLRILATLALTPLIAAILQRRRRRRGGDSAEGPAGVADADT